MDMSTQMHIAKLLSANTDSESTRMAVAAHTLMHVLWCS